MAKIPFPDLPIPTHVKKSPVRKQVSPRAPKPEVTPVLPVSEPVVEEIEYQAQPAIPDDEDQPIKDMKDYVVEDIDYKNS